MLKKSISLPCSLGSMVKLVAKIGGYLGRSDDPPPGHQLIVNSSSGTLRTQTYL
ncbi:MAG: hypothetical protein HUU08_17645 [Candidatus Brocadia sp.]|nr:hypothetical protein [Candidatus Brocadia sp.]